MKALVIFLFAVLSTTLVLAQTDVMTNDTKDRLNTSSMSIGPNSMIYGFDTKKGDVVGDYYHNIDWQDGIVVFYPAANAERPDTISGLPIRYDIYNNEVEFKSTYGIKAIAGGEVKEFFFKNQEGLLTAFFLNTKEIKGAEDKKGFFEVLSEGKLTALLHHAIWVKAPTYNIALDTGSRDTEILKKKAYFYQLGKNLKKFKPTRGSILSIMKNHKAGMEAYFETHSVDGDNPASISEAFEYYNSLK